MLDPPFCGKNAEADHNGTVCMYPKNDAAISEYCLHGMLFISTKKDEYPMVWGQSPSDGHQGSGLVGSCLSAASTLVNHLATCNHQTVQVKEHASAEPLCTLAGIKSQHLSDNMPGSSQSPLSIPHSNYMGFDSLVVGPSTLAARLDSEYRPMDNSKQLQLEFNLGLHPLGPIPSFIQCSDSMSILHPEDSASVVGRSSSSTSTC